MKTQDSREEAASSASALAPSGDADPGQTTQAPRLARSAGAFGFMTLLSRIAGFARDVLQAHLFGAGVATDAFTIAYRIPNYLRRIFAEGSFAMAFVPVFNELKQNGDERALKDFLDHVAGALCAAVLVITALGMLAAPLIVSVVAPGSLQQPEKFALTSEMLRIVFPYLFFISLTALAGAVLNSMQRFALPAFTPVLHNLSVIAAMLLLAGLLDVPAKALAWGVFVAGIAQFLLLWPSLARHGMLPRLRLNLGHDGVRRVGKLMLPTLFSSSVAQINLIIGTAFASLLVAGSQTWLWYSDRLVEFPLGLFGVAIGTVILPHLSRRSAAADTAGFSRGVDWGLRMILLVGLPAAAGLALLAEPLAVVIFQRGAFTAEDSLMTALALTAMSIGVPGFMLSKVLAPAFFSRQDTKTPMRAALWTVAINVSLTVAIVTPLWLNGVPGAHAGIALATALAGLANAALLWRALRRSGGFELQAGWRRFLWQLLLGLCCMAVAVLVLRQQVGDFARYAEWQRWGLLLAAVATGALTYGLGLLLAGLRPRQLRHH
ncbi:murein biosynthesis integral membrane protein MurJ [Pseudomarimonas arenosa]|uniref:Probable lipid II flippase MurJ n=1 Tax=Pseudomarimonas arenosa TaxID=2774145 RepID=A0AAW3ZKL3_9GAMM|nr:murein biosynthesis integral membrane protein MurJ [Pseudomarimonas arenosa]MBD8526561.1 murein biosynthesis integral membrane protein MurJ [Pseudomarimonas arenosa]